MKRLWIAAVAVLSTVGTAQELTILGTIRNKDDGQIVFTLLKGSRKDEQLVVYSTSGGGEIGLFGCYAYVNGQIFVVWSDNKMYSYPIEMLQFSSDAEKAFSPRK